MPLGYKEEYIIPYAKLTEHKTIQEILPEDKCFKILLLEESPNRGHFVCLYRPEDLIVYSNSYDEKHDRDMKCIPRCITQDVGENKLEITRMCDGMKIWYNHKKLQGKDRQTYSQYCVFAIEIMKMGYSPDQVLEALTRYANKMVTNLMIRPSVLLHHRDTKETPTFRLLLVSIIFYV